MNSPAPPAPPPQNTTATGTPKPVILRFSAVGIEIIENRTWAFSVPFDAVCTLKKLCEQIGLCRDFIQDFDFVPSLVKTKFYIRDPYTSAYIVSGNWEGLCQPGSTYEIILKPNREDVAKEMMVSQVAVGVGPPQAQGMMGMGVGQGQSPEEVVGAYGKMSSGQSYYEKMGYAGRKY